MDTMNGLWSEKYRPKIVDDMILPQEEKDTMKSFLEKGEIPNILFVGTPGTGKSTLARIMTLALTNTDEDRLFINGSEQRGIDVVRQTIIPFMSIPVYKSKIKVIFIDECDYLTKETFAALRNTIENPVTNQKLQTRFILTANWLNYIPEPIQSRMNIVSYNQPNKQDIIDRCKLILQFENVSFEDDVVIDIVDNNYPDMRSIISVLEMSVVNGILVKKYKCTQFEQIKTLITKIVSSSTLDEVANARGELIDVFSADYSAIEILRWMLDEFQADPLIHSLTFKYTTMSSNCIDDKHLVLALMSDVILSKFAM